MRLTFDRASNIARIHMKDSGMEPGESVKQVTVAEPHQRGMLILDFDKKGRLLAIEILDATQALPQGALETAERR